MNATFALFDMDGTIVDSLFFWKDKWAEFGRRYLGEEGYAAPPELDRAVRTLSLAETAAFVRESFSLPVGKDELFAFFGGDLLGFYQQKTSVKPGMAALIAHFRAQGIKMGVATATEGALASKVLDHFGLLSCFGAVVSCADGDVCAGKASPNVYEKALRLLGARPEETVLFEDSHVAVQTAKKIGLVTVGIEDPYNENADELRACADLFIRKEEDIFASFQRQIPAFFRA